MPTAGEVEGFAARLGARLVETDDDAARVELIAALESLKAAAAAAQARVSVAFDASQRSAQSAAGVPAADQGKGVAAQVALARKDSPVKGRRHLGLAKALVAEMPHTLAALAAGRISEWRATIMVRETACVSAEHRAEVDRRLSGTPGRLEGLGDQGVARESRRLVQLLDPAAVVRRARRAQQDRRVTLRPAPDTMSYLTALLPVQQGVAVLATLSRHAASLRGQGDPRSKGQIMADTLVQRVTGQTSAADVPVEVHLIMTDKTLLDGDPTPAHLVGYGPVPAGTARDIVAGAEGDPEAQRAQAWIRRLYTNQTGDLVAMDSHRRELPGGLRRFVVARDQFCRTPWCDAPIRHGDHVRRAADGGQTTAANTQGLCAACNYTKEAHGWQTTTTQNDTRGPGAAPDVVTQTPTGHRYTSSPPAPPGTEQAPEQAPKEVTTADVTTAA